MPSEYWIVADDPAGDYLEGAVVDAARARQLQHRGAAVLPYDPSLARRSGVGGYMRRGWGAGYPLDSQSPRMHCPLALYAQPGYEGLYWAARLTLSADAKQEPAPVLDGQVRFGADASQVCQQIAGVSMTTAPMQLAGLGAADARGGWTITGSLKVRVPSEAVYGFAFWGWSMSVLVAWAAVSVVQKHE